MFDSTTTIEAAEITEEELALFDRNIELADRQIAAFDQSFAQLGEQFETLQPIFQAQAELAGPIKELQLLDIERAKQNAPIQDELLKIQLDEIRRGGQATPEQIALIDEIAAKGIETGVVDIERFRDQSLEALREELAPSLGLRPGDTPILDRGADVAAEATRQFGGLVSSLQGGAAAAKLNFPLQASALTSQQAGFQQNLAQSISQFQSELSQAALANRLKLSTDFGSLGINLGTGTAPNISGALSALASTRGGTKTTSDPFGSVVDLVGAAGGLFTGLGSAKAFGLG